MARLSSPKPASGSLWLRPLLRLVLVWQGRSLQHTPENLVFPLLSCFGHEHSRTR
jgi:hypothetical protein